MTLLDGCWLLVLEGEQLLPSDSSHRYGSLYPLTDLLHLTFLGLRNSHPTHILANSVTVLHDVPSFLPIAAKKSLLLEAPALIQRGLVDILIRRSLNVHSESLQISMGAVQRLHAQLILYHPSPTFQIHS